MIDSKLPAYQNPDFPIEFRISDLLDRMTLKEKIAQIHCHGRVVEMQSELFNSDGSIATERFSLLFPDGIGQLGRPSQRLSPKQSAELTNSIQKYLIEETRLAIPALFNEEGLHGLMGEGATSFPQAIALASTWDTELVERIYIAVALETRSRGSNYVYTPVLDLARDPRWGRTEETFGEDPYLVTKMGLAAIHGLQGYQLPIEAQHVIATAKHFAVHGQPEGGMNSAPGNISERIIRGEFLPPFQAAVQGGNVQAVMVSYNEIDGIPAHMNHWLLKDILRKEWGFDGFVTSDGMGVPQLMTIHKVAGTPAHAAQLALSAGVDTEVPQGVCYPSLSDSVDSGDISIDLINQAVARILRAKFRLGLMDQTPLVDPQKAEQINNCVKHQELALEAARKSIILLKNSDYLLPLNPDALNKVAVIGPNADSLHLGGYSEEPGRGFTVFEGLKKKFGDKLQIDYAEGCRITAGLQDWRLWWEDEIQISDPNEDNHRLEDAVSLAADSDVAIVVIGGNEGTCREGWWFNHIGDRDSLHLLGRQQELVDKIIDTGTPTVVVLINGRPLVIPDIATNVPAILECWYPGQEGGIAVAEVIFGETNPSGKLPVTFPRSEGQLPTYYYKKPSSTRGYLFTSTEPLFPFGYGLSYSRFAYDHLRIIPDRIGHDDISNVYVDVTNVSDRAGDEIVQLYVHDQISSITRPVKELKGFQRTHLDPGETKTIHFVITPKELAYFNEEMVFSVEPGIFDIYVGSSSVDNLIAYLEVV